MGSLALLVILVGAFIVYEAVKALEPANAQASGTSGNGSSSIIPQGIRTLLTPQPTGNTACAESTVSGTQYSDSQLQQFAANAGFSGGELNKIVNIAKRESGGWSGAKCVNYNGTVDRGVLQWNNSAWPWSDQQANDPQTAFDLAYKVVHTPGPGYGWQPWGG